MRRLLLALVGIALFGGMVAVSVVRVPPGAGAWCRGRFLGPGYHLTRPFAEVVRYPESDQRLEIAKELVSREGDRHELRCSISYRWDFGRLPSEPIDPRSLDAEILAVIEGLGGSLPAIEMGVGAARVVKDRLAELPVAVIAVRAEYLTPALEELRAASHPSDERVVVVGMDGLDWVLLDRLIARGRCPTFARMKREGAWGHIQARPPLLSPLIWTTMATGRLPEDHGILDFLVKDSATGEDTPITSRSRRVHAFWNVMSDVGRSVHVVNWWATYPAEAINGVMVSERVFYQLFGIRPSLDDPANIAPPELAQQITPLVRDADDVGFDELRRFAEIDRADFDRAVDESRAADNPFANRINHLRKILAVTDAVFDIGAWLLDHRPADVTVLYVEGTDTIGHRFAHFLPPRLAWIDGREYQRYRETMARYYELVDRRLGELMEHAPADTTWLVVADHGFHTGAVRPRVPPDDFGTGAAQWHRMVGVFLASGPKIKGGELRKVHIDDLSRTLLWLQGVPASAELRGRALTELMPAEWVQRHPPTEIASFRDLPRTWMAERSRTSLVDEARLQELRALGYVEDEEVAPGQQPVPPTLQGEAKETAPYNLGKIAHGRGDLDGAERAFLKALEINPEFTAAMVSLAGVYRERGDHEMSLRWILRALQTGGPNLPTSILLDLVHEAEAAGRIDRALPVLEAIRGSWEHSSNFNTARGLALARLGRLDEARTEFRAALEKNPADAIAAEELLKLAEAEGGAGAHEVLESYLEAVENDLKALDRVAVLCLRHNRPDLAERALRPLVESDPTNVGFASNLAVALEMQGRGSEAAAVLARTVEAHPEGADLRFNYGAVLASLGRNDEALRQFDASARLGNTKPGLIVARAKVLVRMGRADEARSTLERGARLHPEHREIRELLQALTSG